MTRSFIFPNHIAEISVSYSSTVKDADRPKVTSSQDANEVLRTTWDKGRIEYIEEFKIILLNRANKVLGVVGISKGGIAGTVADPKVIFAAALKANSSSIILAHNHPSGNLKPSQADISLTKQLREAGKLLDLPILDHIILSKEFYFSFADEGLI